MVSARRVRWWRRMWGWWAVRCTKRAQPALRGSCEPFGGGFSNSGGAGGGGGYNGTGGGMGVRGGDGGWVMGSRMYGAHAAAPRCSSKRSSGACSGAAASVVGAGSTELSVRGVRALARQQ